MSLASNYSPYMALRSSATIGEVLPPRLPLQQPAAIPTPVVEKAFRQQHRVATSHGKRHRNSRKLFDHSTISDDIGRKESDDLSFYDLYRSPCLGITKASNDELLDHVDLEEIPDAERNYIASYNNEDGNQLKDTYLYNEYHYYYDDLEYCGSTFYGGCRFSDLEALKGAIHETESPPATSLSSSTSPSTLAPSYVNWTVAYDYEIHYMDTKRSEDENANREEEEATPSHRSDPIPALDHLETIVLEHLGEVIGLNFRSCDLDDSTSSRQNVKTKASSTKLSDEILERILAISSEPKDILDPDHANCIVPVASTIAQTTECMPVTGGIRVYLNMTEIPGDDNDGESISLADLEMSIQSGFQRLIRFGMQEDLYVTEDDEDEDEGIIVKYVSFIGTRIVSADEKDRKEDKGENIEGSRTQVEEKDEMQIGANTNSLNRGIDGTNSSSVGLVVGFVGFFLGIIIVAAAIIMSLAGRRLAKTEDHRSNDDVHSLVSAAADHVAITPVDIERTLAAYDGRVAEPPSDDGTGNNALKAVGVSRSIMSDTSVEEEVFEDGDDHEYL